MTPYRQGCLDSLCSLYSVVNAVRLAARPDFRIGSEQGKDLIAHLARALGARLGETFVEGLCGLKPLLQAADSWLHNAHHRNLEYSRPFRRKHSPSAEDIGRTIASHLNQAHAAVIVSTTEHWSVVERVTQKRLMLFDSSDRHFLPLIRHGLAANPDKVVLPHRVFLLRITDA